MVASFAEFLNGDEPITRQTLGGWIRRLDALRVYFPDGFDGPLEVSDREHRLSMLQWTAQALNLHGFPSRAIAMFERHDVECANHGTELQLATSLAQHGKSLRQAGRFREADAKNRLSLAVLDGLPGDAALLMRAVTLTWHGMALAQRGAVGESEASFAEALSIFSSRLAESHRAVVAVFLAQRMLWENDPERSAAQAEIAWTISRPLESDPTHTDKWGARKIAASAARNWGESLVLLGDVEQGLTKLHQAYSMANETCFVEEMIPGLRAQAIAARLQGRTHEARQRLDKIWPLTAAGPYPIYECEARMEAARLYEAIGDQEGADAQRELARSLAVADGPPFSFRVRSFAEPTN